jgi:hypothetical protein
MALTIEDLLIELAKVLEPLERRLAAGQQNLLFSEIGLPAPAPFLQVPAVASSLAATITEVQKLPPVVTRLLASIADEDLIAIATAVRDAIPLVEACIDAIDAITAAMQNAAASAGTAQAELEAFLPQLPERLIGYLISSYLEGHHPIIGGIASLFGVIETSPQIATDNAPAHIRRVLRFDRLGPTLNDPAARLAEEYRWGTGPLEWTLLLGRLQRFANLTGGLAVVQRDPLGGPPLLRVKFVDISPTDDGTGIRAVIRQGVPQRLDVSVPIAPGIEFELGVSGQIEAQTGIELLPPGELVLDPPTLEVSGATKLGFAITDPGPGTKPRVLLGTKAGARIEADRIRVAAGADLKWDVTQGQANADLLIEAAIEGGRVVIDVAGADGFLSQILPEDGFAIEFDVLARWTQQSGLSFDAGAGLELDIPIGLDIGPVRIQTIHLALGISTSGFELEVSGAISAKLGPFALVVERMGTTANLSFPASGGNLGPADLGLAFKPPSGIGLSLDAGIVRGGGYLFFDPEKGEYAGVLELAFGGISIKAIGILTTKLPGGADGWALLLAVFGEFPPIQLSWGFTLNGLGGAIGLQHGVSIDALQNGLRTGIIDSVLFPMNPVQNAPTVIRDLRSAFPVVPRSLTIGPALKIGWSTPALVTLKLALLIQLDDVLGSGPGTPSISRIVLLGQLKVQIPPFDELGVDAPALIQLKVDVVGAYDVNEQALSIDAMLRDSHIAFLSLTGSLVVRARFGSSPTFVLAVGGFHPRFHDLPPGIPPQDRVGMQLDYGIVKIRLGSYFAITSNSVQFGAEASLEAAGGGFRVQASVGFDALFLFEPSFHFEIDYSINGSIKYKSVNLASVRVRGVITGPGRWCVSGHATIEVLFFDVDIDFEVAWGDSPAVPPPNIRVGDKIAEQLSDPGKWSATLPSGRSPMVTLGAASAPANTLLAHPASELTGAQKICPLGITLSRVGRSRPEGGDRFSIARADVGGTEMPLVAYRDHFAVGEFLDLKDEEKLARPSFESFDSGVVISSSAYSTGTLQASFDSDYETVWLGEPLRPRSFDMISTQMILFQAASAAVAKHPQRRQESLDIKRSAQIRFEEPAYVLATSRNPGTARVDSPVGSYAVIAEAMGSLSGLLLVDLAETSA